MGDWEKVDVEEAFTGLKRVGYGLGFYGTPTDTHETSTYKTTVTSPVTGNKVRVVNTSESDLFLAANSLLGNVKVLQNRVDDLEEEIKILQVSNEGLIQANLKLEEEKLGLLEALRTLCKDKQV